MSRVWQRLLPVKDSGRAQDAAHASQGTKASQDQMILFFIIPLFFFRKTRTLENQMNSKTTAIDLLSTTFCTTNHQRFSLIISNVGHIFSPVFFQNMGRSFHEEMYHQPNIHYMYLFIYVYIFKYIYAYMYGFFVHFGMSAEDMYDVLYFSVKNLRAWLVHLFYKPPSS